MSKNAVRSSAAQLRIERAEAWLSGRDSAEQVLVIAASRDAANDLLRRVAAQRGAAFGWHRATLARVAAALAAPVVVDRNLASIGALACEAVVARAVHAQRQKRALGRFTEIANGPGFARAAARSLAELRLARLSAAGREALAPEISGLLEAYEHELDAAGLADRAAILGLAEAVARDRAAPHALLDLPTLLLDLAVDDESERALVAAIAARAPELLATVAAGDRAPLTGEIDELDAKLLDDASSLRRLQVHLFGETAPAPAPLGEDVTILSAPGESRECVEIARQLQQLAARGIAFDRMAILLRSPEEYRPHLEEALARADVPAHFARGARQPDPTGRAFLALLACAAERLSARRFAEYLSLGEVPDAASDGAPPAPAPPAERWVAPDEELVPEAIAAALSEAAQPEPDPLQTAADPDTAPVSGGALRAPRRWEQLLVDAAVIGGRERWQRRLDGLERALELDLEELDDPAAERVRRDLENLASLRNFALPLIDTLSALPESASWGSWPDALGALATSALRHPNRVLATLSELMPMAAVGPVELSEVQSVLARRLLEVSVPPSTTRYGRVFVAPVEAARGLGFEVVFVPGLAERLFPRKIREDPILPDSARETLAAAELAGSELAGSGLAGSGLETGARGLPTNADRVAAERRALRIAVGAARDRLVLSYPRLDLDQSRPRVPSFYALEALRAAEGRLPGFDELAQRAEMLSEARVGWPAPARSEDAIDEAEHDLALLDALIGLDPERSVGMARFLVTANPHLGRALRFRARRWLEGWTAADGLVKPSTAAREAIRAHALDARSYSATALQNYAACPYKFFLSAIHRLSPVELPEAIEELDPLQRGSLVHEVQFELFEKLRDASLLPVDPSRLERARELLDDVIDAVAKRYRDELAPAIDRVWEDGVSSVRADLREWLRRAAHDDSGFVPWRFEFSFGLAGRRNRDRHSSPEPVVLDCGIQLRGSIDLVERSPAGELRVTDHKTGKVRVGVDAIVGGGESLQPVLYALAAERAFTDARVGAGRLYYCTQTGNFAERVVALDQRARDSAQQLADAVGAALDEPFLPAAPAPGACRFCDYRVVCGPYEELRTRRKWRPPLERLDALRELP